MKKIYAMMLTIMLVFSMAMPVYAASPSGNPTEDEPGESSPKTGDLSLVTIGLAGGVCAVTSLVASKKSKKED